MSYFIRQSPAPAAKLSMFQLFQDKACILLHLPQSLSSIFFDGIGIYRASVAFIIVKRVTGFFCSFCKIESSQKVSFHSIFLSLQLSHFFLVDFSLFILLQLLPFSFESQSKLCYTICLQMGLLKFSLSILFSPNPNINVHVLVLLNAIPHQKDNPQ